MKRLFISQPMRGKTDEQILSERERAIQSAKEYLGEEVEVIDTFYTDFSKDTKPLEYLARNIKDLTTADVAYFVSGWNEFRGCKIEHMCVVEYGINRIEE
ncbi:MAG: hypothetical protein ACLTJE_01685 [Enterocloster bolteae]|uniref:hypothetical protein n=1 Tax=Enterocloster bolteae TaxID=208479 RepID=UPI003993C1A5